MAAAPASVSVASPRASKSPVNEAIVIAYTGSNSFEGVGTDSAVAPAVWEINQAGGILGHKLNTIHVDTRSDPADALPAVEKALATTPNIIGAVGVGTTSGPTIIPILNAAHVPMMANAGEAAFDRSNYHFFWRLVPPDPVVGEGEALWAKHMHYTRVATVFGTDAGSQGDLPGVIVGLKDVHVKLVSELNLPVDQPSYQAQVAQLLAAHPQVIITESDGPTAATFFGEMKQLGHLVPMIAANSALQNTWSGPVSGALGKVDFEKYITALAVGSPSPTPALAEYKFALGKAPGVAKPVSQWFPNPYVQATYDGVIVQALAMEAAHSVNPATYNNDIFSVTKPGRGKIKVYNFASGKKLLEQGKQIQYIGAGGPVLFDQWHNSFGNVAAETDPLSGSPTLLGIIKASAIQALK